MNRQVTYGLVLRQTETKEADKILTVLTPDLGKVAVIARGCRRKSSKIAASSQLLVYSEMTLYQRAGWYYLDEASTVELFSGVREDVQLLSLASYFAELTESLTGEEAPAPEVLHLLLNALYALGVLHRDEALVKAAFELRLLALSGFAPLIDRCAVCDRVDPEEAMLDVVQGVLHCRACAVPGGLSLPLPPATLAAVRYILGCEEKKLYSFKLEGVAQEKLCQAAEAFVSAQLERSFRTLDFYKSIKL
jgi:DNA repair protein RecO (recombination protein O)